MNLSELINLSIPLEIKKTNSQGYFPIPSFPQVQKDLFFKKKKKTLCLVYDKAIERLLAYLDYENTEVVKVALY